MMLRFVNVRREQPSPQTFSARSNLDPIVSRDITERDSPRLRADNGTRETARD